jgi:aquaporin Z
MTSTTTSRTGTPAPSESQPVYRLGARLLAEVFGTFVLVFGVIGTALFASSNTGYLGVALAVGLAVMVSAYAVGHISGGHFNPAVTIGAAAAGRLPWKHVVPYWVAQIVGGAIASTLLFLIAAGGPKGFLKAAQAGGFASNGYGAHSPGGFDLASVIIVEVVLSAAFLYVILSVTAPGSSVGAFAPLAIGLALTMVHLVAIPVSNSSVNPARSIATAIYGGPAAQGQLWVFLLAPLVGGLIAGLTWKPLFSRARRLTTAS